MLCHEQIGEVTYYRCFIMESTWSNGGNKQKEVFLGFFILFLQKFKIVY